MIQLMYDQFNSKEPRPPKKWELGGVAVTTT